MAPGGQLKSRQQSTPARRSSEEEDVWRATTLCCAAIAHPSDCSGTASGTQQLLQEESSHVKYSRHPRVSIRSPSTGIACAAGLILCSPCSTP